MTIDELLQQSQEIEAAARKLQTNTTRRLPDVEVEAVANQYRVWYARCLSLLSGEPDEIRRSFVAEYEGTKDSPKIRLSWKHLTQHRGWHLSE